MDSKYSEIKFHHLRFGYGSSLYIGTVAWKVNLDTLAIETGLTLNSEPNFVKKYGCLKATEKLATHPAIIHLDMFAFGDVFDLSTLIRNAAAPYLGRLACNLDESGAVSGIKEGAKPSWQDVSWSVLRQRMAGDICHFTKAKEETK